jgi:hypothetical protein
MNNFLKAPALRLTQWIIGCAAAGLMAACGGGQPDQGQRLDPEVHTLETLETNKHLNPYAPGNATVALSAGTIAAFQEGARLNSAELEQIAKTGVIPKAFEGPLLGGATTDVKPAGRKSTATRTPVYRFFNRRTSAHFFTTSTTERDNVIATLPFMSYEGPAFYASASAVPGLSPVHRFYNIQTGVHFYTISESERAYVEANLPQFHYEGIAYFASTLEGAGYTPLYRFFYSAKGFHFYTNSLSERDNIIATLPQYHYEGVGYYVLGSDWQVPRIPKSGVTFAQCYQANSDVLVDCNSTGAKALNERQDGHRYFSDAGLIYQSVPSGLDSSGATTYYPLTSCFRDTVTGLIWESKKASGDRAGTNRYTNLSNHLATDASGYVDALNATQHCGFSDWRLPTVEELQGVLDFSATSGPMVNQGVHFPNTPATEHWTGTAYVGTSTFPSAWTVSLSTGNVGAANRSTEYAVRLVRGSPWTGPRYIVTSASYSGDATNNVVLDRRTGVQWRRCLTGQLWSGSACTGSAAMLNHDNALRYTRSFSGWRLPSIKELGSLVDFSRTSPALDVNAFPGASTTTTWSSTPYVQAPSLAFSVGFMNGTQFGFTGTRTNTYGLRLVVDPEGQ